MARTNYTEVTHKLVDPEAKADAEYTLSDKQEQTSYAQIQNDTYTADRIMTGEPNAGLLDGNTRLQAPDSMWGLWSGELTDTSGDFAANPILSVEFEAVHTTVGITFTFGGDTTPRQVTISWYFNETLLAAETFDVDGFTFFAERLVENYNAVTVEFIGTKIPQRRLKIIEIDYGAIRVWDSGNIIRAQLLEEVDPTSTEITTNKLILRVYDVSESFNMLNPTGVYAALRQKQELATVEYLNGVAIKMGKHYLDTWSNISPTTAEFEAYDATYLFESVTYMTSSLWNGTPAADVLASIFAAAGWTDYTVEEDIGTELVYGYIPVTTVREALHQACFALRAAYVVKRDGGIAIMRLPTEVSAKAIEKTRKTGQQSITQTPLVNSVAVTAYSIQAAAATTQLYSVALVAGTHTIVFTNPATGLSITGGTITDSGIHYAVVDVVSPGTVTITGQLYGAQANTIIYEAPGLIGSTRSQAVVENNYLISSVNAAALAQFLYEDYQCRIIQRFDLALEDEAPGNNTDVDTMLGARKTGIITRLDTDLSGGFKAAVEVRG